jgi:glycosyltransferase involved in cell wall biosynthesis
MQWAGDQPGADAAAATELSILMPVYNERERVEAALDDVLSTEFPFEYELIVVDDGSTDGTTAVLEAFDWPANARLVRHGRNRGKGAALRTALEHATGTYTAVMDADLEYAPADLELLLEPLHRGESNAVFGVRAFDGYTSHSFWFVLGNRGVTLAANVLYNVYLRDIMTCHKAIRTDVFKSLPLREDGFAIEPEIVARLLQRGERIFEVPAHYKARATADGKKLRPVDGLRVVRTLVRCRLSGPATHPPTHDLKSPAAVETTRHLTPD